MTGSVDAVLIFEGHKAHKIFKKLKRTKDWTFLVIPPRILII